MSTEAIARVSPGAGMSVSRWRNLPWAFLGFGGAIAVIGALKNPTTFGYSYLTAYIFFLSICFGCLFLVLVHHLFDASWSVPIRRTCEHVACLLFPVMAVLWIPIGLTATKVYPWMNLAHADHALHAKAALLNKPTWYGISIALFLVWWFLTNRLRYWSLKQDETGSPLCTYKMRFHAAWGIFAFAITVSLAIILWVKSLEHWWFSTMYGVYYFAESVWTTLATVYVMTLLLKRAGPLANVTTPRQFHDLGVLWFAFTVFYAYIHFSQYFIIWNANMPEETAWYKEREAGSWWDIGMLIIFGHFFLPFLALLRIDAKLNLAVMIPLAAWAWLMHFCDVAFNILPVLYKDGFRLHPVTVGSLMLIFGVLVLMWLKYFRSHPPYPQKDPRMLEALGLHHPQASPHSVAKYEGQA